MMRSCGHRLDWRTDHLERNQRTGARSSRRPRRDPSARSIIGFLLALVVVWLFFTASIGALWLVVVIGLYLSRVLRMPPPQTIAPPPPPTIDPRRGSDADGVRKHLDHEISIITGRIPPDILAKVQSIRQIILEILPRARALPMGSPELFVVERTATEYLPKALESYLNLPRAYAMQARIQDGKTPTQVLMDQVTLLESKMSEIADHVHRIDADRLLANGRFLEERFGRSALSLPNPPSGP